MAAKKELTPEEKKKMLLLKKKAAAAAKAVTETETTEDDDLGLDEEEAPKKGKAKKEAKPKKEKEEGAIEGLSKATKESGIIFFKKGSGSQALLLLIAKYGYDREKVLKAAATLKENGKAFEKSDPAKKYSKVAGLIKQMQNAGFKLPEVGKKKA